MTSHSPLVRPSAPVPAIALSAFPVTPRRVALAAALLAANCAQAQEAASADATEGKTLQEMVVTANRIEQPLSDLTADMSIIDDKTLQRQGPGAIADVLARVPGIQITRNGGPGAATSVFIRGAESRFTAVYVDGVRLDSQSTGGASWQSLPLALIDRVEVLRGPAAAVYGSDAMGGVVQIFTKKGEGAPKPYVGLGVGNRGTSKLEAGVSGATGVDNAFDYAFSLAHERSDGWDIRAGVPHNPDSDDYRSTSGHARLGFKIDARHRLDATLLANQLNSGYDAYLSGIPKPSTPLDDDRNKERLRTAGLTWTADWSDAYTMRLSATDSYSRYETTPSPYLTETRLRNYLWQNDYRLGVHRFSAALERREDELTNPALDAWSTAIRGSRAQNALALGYGLHAGAHTLQLHWRHDDDSEFGIKNTASAAYGYAFAPHWRATASWGSAFRAPTLYQRFSEYGNPALQPETSYNSELGLRYDQGHSSASLVVYRNRVSNLINFVGAGTCASAYGCYANTAHARYQGVTLAGSQRWGGVQLHGSIDWQDPRNLDTDKRLARRAQRYATLGADTRLADWTLGGEVQAAGQRFDDAANKTRLGGYTLFNLHASTPVARDTQLLARVDNLGDKRYQLANTYVPPGRMLYVGLKWAPQ